MAFEDAFEEAYKLGLNPSYFLLLLTCPRTLCSCSPFLLAFFSSQHSPYSSSPSLCCFIRSPRCSQPELFCPTPNYSQPSVTYKHSSNRASIGDGTGFLIPHPRTFLHSYPPVFHISLQAFSLKISIYNIYHPPSSTLCKPNSVFSRASILSSLLLLPHLTSSSLLTT